MAGFIYIKEDEGLSVNSIAFNAIAELSREFFNGDESIIGRVYSPLDEGGLDMLSLDKEKERGFNIFYCGIKAGYDKCKLEGKCGKLDKQYFSLVMKSWKELIQMLEDDERFISTQSGVEM